MLDAIRCMVVYNPLIPLPPPPHTVPPQAPDAGRHPLHGGVQPHHLPGLLAPGAPRAAPHSAQVGGGRRLARLRRGRGAGAAAAARGCWLQTPVTEPGAGGACYYRDLPARPSPTPRADPSRWPRASARRRRRPARSARCRPPWRPLRRAACEPPAAGRRPPAPAPAPARAPFAAVLSPPPSRAPAAPVSPPPLRLQTVFVPCIVLPPPNCLFHPNPPGATLRPMGGHHSIASAPASVIRPPARPPRPQP
jgi:hypothetical protein